MENTIYAEIDGLNEANRKIMDAIIEAVADSNWYEFMAKLSSHDVPIITVPLLEGARRHEFPMIITLMPARLFGTKGRDALVEALSEEERETCVQTICRTLREIWDSKAPRGSFSPQELNRVAFKEGNREFLDVTKGWYS